jgi:hypothetical protein
MNLITNVFNLKLLSDHKNVYLKTSNEGT